MALIKKVPPHSTAFQKAVAEAVATPSTPNSAFVPVEPLPAPLPALPHERVQLAYKALAQTAVELNDVSDEMSRALALVDAGLEKLSLGVTAWVVVSGDDGSDGSGDWWSRELGYTKVGNVWGVALKRASGNYHYDEANKEQVYLFKDAPRWMRLEAVASIPQLLEALLKRAQDTIEQSKKTTVRITEFAAAMASAAEPPDGVEDNTKDGW